MTQETTREHLMSAGEDLFALRGFDGTTTDAIARRAGVNKALISYHFGGKSGLYLAILDSTFRAIQADLDALQQDTSGADEKLRRFVAAFARLNRSRPGFSAMVLREVLSGGRHLDERVLPAFLSIFAHVNRIVSQGIREGTFRPVDPLLTHLSLVGGLVFFFATGPLRERLIAERRIPVVAPEPEQFVEHTKTLFSRGLAPQTGDGA